MIDDIVINEFLGFKVFYRSGGRQFIAKKGELELEAPDEDTLKILIKRQKAELRKFKPVDVIKCDDLIVGRITSRAADLEEWIYFSYKGQNSQPRHSKELLGHYTWENSETKEKPKFVFLTDKNRQILADIRKEQEAIESCDNAISALKQKFEKPVTWETLEQAGDKT
jgi:hypothetical protein